jgi:hypothetical protein
MDSLSEIKKEELMSRQRGGNCYLQKQSKRSLLFGVSAGREVSKNT